MVEAVGPLMSIVTVVFNAKDSLEETITSVLNQSYQHVEYIIIDGGSRDGSVELIRRHHDRLAYWISEQDRGIYDAMNKGVAAASGEWLLFMNAGDRFYSSNTLDILCQYLSADVDVIYGDVEIRYDDFHIVKRAGNIKNIWRGMPFCHQSSAVKRGRLVGLPFNIDNPIAADLEWFIRAYDSGWVYFHHNQILSSISAGGVSDVDQYQAVISIEKAVRCVRNDWWLGLYFMAAKSLTCLKMAIKSTIPGSVLQRIRKVRAYCTFNQ